MCPSLCHTPFNYHPCICSFLDYNLSKYQWIFTKLDMCIDIVEICLGIVISLQNNSGRILQFHVFIFLYFQAFGLLECETTAVGWTFVLTLVGWVFTIKMDICVKVPDKREYLQNIFLISPQKYTFWVSTKYFFIFPLKLMLWVLIRRASEG